MPITNNTIRPLSQWLVLKLDGDIATSRSADSLGLRVEDVKVHRAIAIGTPPEERRKAPFQRGRMWHLFSGKDQSVVWSLVWNIRTHGEEKSPNTKPWQSSRYLAGSRVLSCKCFRSRCVNNYAHRGLRHTPSRRQPALR